MLYHSDDDIAFFAAGFETTTAPVAAMLVEGVPDNLSLLLSGRLTWPAVAMLLDSGAARETYQKALAIDPSYLPAIKALKLIYYLDKEYDDYLEMMAQEAEHTEDVEEKTRLFHEIGEAAR